MGWRTDQAYEDEQRRVFQTWKQSLTRGEYLAWQWRRWASFFGGVAVSAIVCSLIAAFMRL